MEPALEAYIVNTHTEQIKDIKERLHTVSNILTKEQQVLDSVEKNIDKVTLQLERHSDRLDKLEKINLENDIKLGFIKSLGKNSKWILICVILICAIFNEQISPIITHFKQQYLGASK